MLSTAEADTSRNCLDSETRNLDLALLQFNRNNWLQVPILSTPLIINTYATYCMIYLSNAGENDNLYFLIM